MKIILFGIRKDSPDSGTKKELETLEYPLTVEEYSPELISIEENVYSKQWFELNPTIKLDDSESENN